MSPSLYGRASRRPVYSGGRRVQGLVERTTADGRIVYEARARLSPKASPKRVVLDARNKTEAIDELRALRVDVARGHVPQTSSLVPTVAELAEEWLALLDARTRHRDPSKRFSPRTVALYRSRVSKHIEPRVGGKPVDEVGVADLCRLIDELGLTLAPSTVTGVLNVLSGLLRHAKKSGLVERNVVRDLDRDDRPGTGRLTEPRYLDLDQLTALLDELSDVFRPVIAVCMYAGLRVSEALGLVWEAIDFESQTIDVRRQLDDDGSLREQTKSPASTAKVPLLPALERELRQHRSRQAERDLRRMHRSRLVFVTAQGKPQSRRNALRAVHAAGDKLGLNPEGVEPVGLHDLRHSFVALALGDGGLTLAETALLARHKNAKVTAAIYAGVNETAKGQLAAKLVESGIGG